MTLPFAAFAVVLLATGLMRLIELVVSVRRIRERPEDAVAEPWLFPLMAVLHTGLIVAPLLEVVLLGRPFRLPVFLVAVGLLVVATLLRVWTLRTIGAAWNVRVVRPREGMVVTTGPYAYIRHPNYLVVILEIVALPLLHGGWISAIALSALNAFVLWHRLRTEEATLATLPAWSQAMEGKARLIPGVL